MQLVGKEGCSCLVRFCLYNRVTTNIVLDISCTARRDLLKLWVTPRFSRCFFLPPDEAETEHEHPKGKQYCTNIGEIDEPVRSFGIRRQYGEEEGRWNQDRSDRD
jgi:hypothetical protein